MQLPTIKSAKCKLSFYSMEAQITTSVGVVLLYCATWCEGSNTAPVLKAVLREQGITRFSNPGCLTRGGQTSRYQSINVPRRVGLLEAAITTFYSVHLKLPNEESREISSRPDIPRCQPPHRQDLHSTHADMCNFVVIKMKWFFNYKRLLRFVLLFASAALSLKGKRGRCMLCSQEVDNPQPLRHYLSGTSFTPTSIIATSFTESSMKSTGSPGAPSNTRRRFPDICGVFDSGTQRNVIGSTLHQPH